MTQPVRGSIHVAVEYDVKPEKATLRDLMEWYKKVVRAGMDVGKASPMEISYIEHAWVAYVSVVAAKQKVPVGALAAFLQEIARAETRALELAEVANE